ncbi:MAG: ASCH domain-containing protein [Opitutales bacterium]
MAALPVSQFGLTPADWDETARLVLTGDKRATTGLHAAYAFDREPLPQVGRCSRVRDGRGRDIAVIETTQVEVRRYCDVDATYAAIEGEGDKSLAHWQRVHWAYLTSECARVGVPLAPDVEVVLEYFRVVTRCRDVF